MKFRTSIRSILAASILHTVLLHGQAVSPDSFDPKASTDQLPDPNAPAKLVLILPSDKSTELVKDDDRNPFGKSEDDAHGRGDRSTNEENKIQEQLAKLRATGVAPDGNGLRLLLGDMILSEGEIMPAVIKDQTLALRVKKVTRRSVEFVWVEGKPTGLPPRTLTLPVDLTPAVRYVRHGQPSTAKARAESEAVKRANALQLPAPVIAGVSNAEPTPAAVPAAPAAPAAAPAAKTPATSPLEQLASLLPAAKPQSAPDAPVKENSALKIQPVAQQAAAAPAPAAEAPPKPAAAPEPESWKRAMGLMNNLAKVAEVGK